MTQFWELRYFDQDLMVKYLLIDNGHELEKLQFISFTQTVLSRFLICNDVKTITKKQK